MPIPKNILGEVSVILDAYCLVAIPEDFGDNMRIGYRVRSMTITLFESRKHWKDASWWIEYDIARFRYNRTNLQWSLYSRGKNLSWHIYMLPSPTPEFCELLAEVKADRFGIFWG